MNVSELKPFEGSEVVLHLKDGEVLRVKIHFVDSEYQDIVVDVLETNQPEHYKDPHAAYTIAASDVIHAKSAN